MHGQLHSLSNECWLQLPPKGEVATVCEAVQSKCADSREGMILSVRQGRMITIIYALQAGCIANRPFALRERFSLAEPSGIAIYKVASLMAALWQTSSTLVPSSACRRM